MNTTKEQIKYWQKSSKRDFKTASELFKLKRYDACLFFCHLALEKILKGLVVEVTKKTPPYIHDLAKLANTAELELSEDQIQNLRAITGFNIASRYNDEKFLFYKKCTKAYTEKYIKITKNLYLWAKKNYQKK